MSPYQTSDKAVGGNGTAAVLISPVLMIIALVFAVAVGHDLFHFAGEAPIALGLCAPAAYLVVRLLVPRLAAWLGEPEMQAGAD